MEVPVIVWASPLLTGCGVGALAFYIWRNRTIPGAGILATALFAVAHWSLVSGMEYRCMTMAGREFWWPLEMPGLVAVPVCWFLLTCTYTGRPVGRAGTWWLFAIPLGTVVMHWTNRWHHLYWQKAWVDVSGPVPSLGRVYGAGFWVFVSYEYLLMAATLVMLLRFVVRHPAQRRQTGVLIASMLLPWVTNAMYVFEVEPLRYLDLTPQAFLITGMGIWWALYRYSFQGIVPVAWKAVVSSMDEGVIVFDIERRVADLNPAAEALLGCRAQQVQGHGAAEVFAAYPDLAALLAREAGVAKDVSLQTGELRRVCAVRVAPVARGARQVGRMMTLRDVTLERAASRELEQARQVAEAAVLAKSRFLANMSHEIRTPMNGVLGMTRVLLDSNLNAEQADMAATVQESAEGLLALLNDILDYSRIEAGKLELEQVSFSVARLVGQVVRLFKPAASRKGLDIRTRVAADIPESAVGDPARLRQVLLNLLGNAIKFTPSGTVDVTVVRLAPRGQPLLLSFTVTDSGIGIAPDRVGQLFQEFSQADPSIARQFGGSGLGLAISRRLVEGMGGTIRVQSVLNQGTSFTVEMPLGVADSVTAAGAATPEPTLAALPGWHVLLAEDNPVNRRVGRATLEKLGCQVDFAIDGRAAVDAARSTPYDAILMDLQMPGVDGIEATREIRRAGLTTAIVAMTASVDRETRAACEEAGMDGFVGKPFRPDDIAVALGALAGRRP